MDQNLEEAKKLNQQSRQGGSGSIDTTSANSESVKEARELNQKYPNSTSSSSSGSSSSSYQDDLEEAKKLNAQSRQNKGQQQ